jgi:hypothetical protein
MNTLSQGAYSGLGRPLIPLDSDHLFRISRPPVYVPEKEQSAKQLGNSSKVLNAVGENRSSAERSNPGTEVLEDSASFLCRRLQGSASWLGGVSGQGVLLVEYPRGGPTVKKLWWRWALDRLAPHGPVFRQEFPAPSIIPIYEVCRVKDARCDLPDCLGSAWPDHPKRRLHSIQVKRRILSWRDVLWI